MDNLIIIIKLVCSVIVGFIIKHLGGWDIALESLFTLTVLDFITGVIVAICDKSLSSNIAIKGIAKKIGIYTLIAVVEVGGKYMGNEDLRNIVVGFFIAAEAISVIENWGNFGLPIPPQLKNILADLKERQGENKSEK